MISAIVVLLSCVLLVVVCGLLSMVERHRLAIIGGAAAVALIAYVVIGALIGVFSGNENSRDYESDTPREWIR